MRRALSLHKTFPRVRQFHSSFYAAKLVVEKVPALGESITEGTIASWSKSEGDRVAVDDVIVIVETDKVTVDIKSTHAGVLTKKIAVDNVVVGAPLYEIDTDGSVSAAPAAKSDDKPPSVAQATSTKAADHKEEHHRVPSIKFIGKRDKTQKHATQPAAPAAAPRPAAPSASAPVKVVKEGNGVLFTTLPGMGFFGRPPMTLKEIEAIESGGATL